MMTTDMGIDALEAAGWSAERRVSLDRLESAFREHDHHRMWPEARRLLSNITDLEIQHDRGGRPDFIRFDTTIAAFDLAKGWIDSYSKRVDQRLLPFGHAESGHLILLLAVDGAIYGSYDHFLTRLGGTVFEAIETILTGKKTDVCP